MHPTTSRAALVNALFALFDDTASTFRQPRTYHRALALALGFLSLAIVICSGGCNQ